jgi:uncharacterized membrane protein YgcG
VVAVGVGLGVLAIVAVVVALSGGGSRKATTTQASARSGPITLRYTAPWRAAASPSAAATGVLVSQPAPLRLASTGARLDAGLLAMSAAIPGDVPPVLRSRYGAPSASLAATVGGDPAREYRWKASGLDAFIIPTTSRDLAILCTSTSTAAARSCASLATAAALSGAQLLAPGPDAALAGALARSVTPAATARRNLKGLQAGKLTDRAAPARAMSKADDAAATSLVQQSVPVRYQPAVSSLASALRAEAAALGALGSAAQHNDRKGYAGAAKDVTGASQKLAAAAGALRADGMALPALGTLAVPRLPAPPKPSPPPASSPSSSGSGASQSGSGASQSGSGASQSGSGASQSAAPSQSYSPPAQSYSPPAQSYSPPAPSQPSSPPSHSGGGSGGGGGTVTSPTL